MFYRLVAVSLASTLLISCGGESAFSDFTATATTTTSGGGGGGDGGTTTGTGNGNGNGNGNGTPTNFSNIALKSHIPLSISDGLGGTLGATFQSFDMGNSDDSISYILRDSNGMEHVFKPDVSGPVELYSRPSPEVIFTITAGNGNKILSWNGVKDVIDYADGNTLSIGTVLGLQAIDTITDAGDAVAFAANDDLTGANPTGVNQLFTLSTDGADTYNQITTFTIDQLIEYVVISGDGARIFFSSTGDVLGGGSNVDGSYEIFSINSDGSGLTQLSDLNTSLASTTHASTDGGMITFEFIDSDGLKWLSTLNTTSSVISEIAVTSGAAFTIDHDLSADGTKVTYLGATGFSTPVIYVVNSDGTSKTNELAQPGTMRSLHINTDGTQITFYSNIDFGKAVGPDEQAIQIYTLTVQ
jgi:hypothetical protein